MISELIRTRQWATEAGTAHYKKVFGRDKRADAYREIARMQLSGLGIGTYLGAADDATDARYIAAITAALRGGINVIDTASNYRDGRSERCVGAALKRLIDREILYRSEVLLATKVGFVPADCAGLVPEGELVAGCHCMAPNYIDALLDRSLAALGVPTVDVCFVHNPETQLAELGREAVYERLRAAFVTLEKAADAGKLRAYGVATWSGLITAPDGRDHLGMERIEQLAQEVAGTRHRCRAVQLPVNLALTTAVDVPTQPIAGVLVPALMAAKRLGLVTFASAALMQGELVAAHGAAAAVRWVMEQDGVTTALCGMSRAEHVDEVVAGALVRNPR